MPSPASSDTALVKQLVSVAKSQVVPSRFTQADTVKLPSVRTSTPVVVTTSSTPSSLTALPIRPAVNVAPLRSVACRGPTASPVVVPLPSSIVQLWPRLRSCPAMVATSPANNARL